jgi:mono/diheme cytochrome c family protein
MTNAYGRFGLAGARWLAALSLCAAAAADTTPPDAAKIYAAHCVLCHGKDGKAPTSYARRGVPDLNDPAWQKSRSDADIRKMISEGSEGTLMKGFKDDLSAAEIDALVKHIRSLSTAAAK